MTSKRIITALTAVALGGMLLAGCTATATPTPKPTTATPTPTPITGTKVPPPANEEEATTAAQKTLTEWFDLWSEIEVSGSSDTSPLKALSTGRALQIAQNSIEHLQNGPIPDESGDSIEGAGTITGKIKFEPKSLYGQLWEATENGLVTIDGCQDISERIVTTHDGTPAQRNDSLRNMVEYKVIYDASQQFWLVQDQIDLQQTC